jgi:hypothetical protein
MVAKLWYQKKPKTKKIAKKKVATETSVLKLPQVQEIIGKNVTEVTLSVLAAILFGARNKFFRVMWLTDISARLRKKHEVTVPDLFGGQLELTVNVNSPFHGKAVSCLYCCTMRNDFDFKTSVLAELKRRGQSKAGKGWTPENRSWGQRVGKKCPFILYQAKTPTNVEPERLYGNFLPGINPRTKKHAYADIPGVTGYWLGNHKTDDELVEAFLPERKKPTEALAAARLWCHPVCPRLDGILCFKIAGKWYKVKPPTKAEIISLAGTAVTFSNSLAETED